MQRSRNIQPVTVMHPIEMIAKRPVTADTKQFVITAAEYLNYWKYKNFKTFKYVLINSKSEPVGIMRELMLKFHAYFGGYDFTPFLDWATDNWDNIQKALVSEGRLYGICSRQNIKSLTLNSDLCFAWYKGGYKW